MSAHISDDVAVAARILQQGGLVAFATETVYGLGANALDPTAVARIFEAKGRPKFDPLIVHVAERESLNSLVSEIPERANDLMDRFWAGPLTLVLPKTEIVPDLVTAGLNTVAIRMPDHPLALELIRLAEVPVAAPSANLFGHVSPTSAQHVAEQLGEKVDLILDGGPCRVGLESTVVSLVGSTPQLLRPGGLPREDIEAIIGPVEVVAETDNPVLQAPAAPGMLPRHYAPGTRLVVVDPDKLTGSRINELADELQSNGAGLLSFGPVAAQVNECFKVVEVLSDAADLREAATGFFAALRRLDCAEVDVIVATRFPNEGLGVALNDRLQRAAYVPEN